ncbi:MAG: septum formation protein Maf [Desulfovibrio sp.]|nr:septum formation protein Maf [Desulfovibrio sp.]
MHAIFQLCPETELILASNSPRRAAFLEKLGLPFRIVTGNKEEVKPSPGEKPSDFTLRAAWAKANDAKEILKPKAPSSLILSADTVVTCEEKILGKPQNEAQALKMLSFLAGKTHTVTTSVTLLLLGPKQDSFSFSETTKVHMAPFGQAVLLAYLSSGEAQDKAGAYAIQDKGAFLIQDISGSYTNVVGLPLCRLVDELLKRSLLKVATA